MAVFDLEERVEEAFKAVLEAATLPDGVTILTAFENKEIKEPAVLIMLPASDIPEEEQGLERPTGNRQGVLTVGILTHSDYGLDNHRTLVAAVRDLFYDSAFAGTLNSAAEGVSVSRVDPVGSDRAAKEGNSFLTSLQAELWFRPVPVVPDE
jgi:hypothetical protein